MKNTYREIYEELGAVPIIDAGSEDGSGVPAIQPVPDGNDDRHVLVDHLLPDDVQRGER